ncbi:MAG: hypothetical protein COU47_00820 [Candidatus Niyogibacteria bacterium CG10_big_fil_rev_8_21_14_0_10_46_36]|uniref:Short-chain dehydrogenase n=1 Tax=Candidatus Niyogibacteria bacterium CG10_big_fil_rev_8_21_14_0_10_46_36 TaxID=1974726 RepID=A0A2H0TEJ1_9BACT|nr:MAG: hypothetical protein COU47_00820 [Candidatus Niyogibacteria bacterium CG10_big_fil_rev_8_21_14_0_10_46_36]
MGKYTGQTVLVTGATQGVGKAIAEAFAEANAYVIVCGRNEVRLQNTKKQLLLKGAAAVFLYAFDFADAEGAKKALSNIQKDHKRIDILVNNVGDPSPFGNFFELSDEDWTRSYEINCMSMVRMVRGVLPCLCQSHTGRIINIASMSAVEPGMYNPHYVAAKAGMVAVSKYLSRALADKNILVNAICPGTLTGDAWERNIRDFADRHSCGIGEARSIMEEQEKKKVPLARMGSPEDVARLVLFLASDAADFITGECICLDGGRGRSVL